ncbi:MAG: restriction endonuclease [Planctomycetes bacterium RBG_16_55_9]|nr:MAG: restriction endonuclease [Planctomycetes bacterium RBG_16_55_9]
MEHEFTKRIREILQSYFGDASDSVFSKSEIIQYLNIKTKSASKGSKSRGSFANLYAVYVLVEDYLSKGFDKSDNYGEYEGAVFTSLFKRQRELPFGQKLQNHALNHRMNEEFRKYFRTCDYIPILRDPQTNRYWFNENLLKIAIDGQGYNLAEAIIDIIDTYVETKKSAFQRFIRFCESSQTLEKKELIDFIHSLVEPTVDARIFEIVSYSILKYYYSNQILYWGFEIDEIQQENLRLFKTGRTNANDGGIDFVMKPLGRFFQVTETVDMNKYFLDIDKIEKYPITFVIKSSDSIESLKNRIKLQAEKQYSIKAIVTRYLKCIEEIINVPVLLDRFTEAVEQEHLGDILAEIVKQSKVEFNFDDDYDISGYQDIEDSE